jgi:NTP pyrophosphatase (non-canonical NTP hydrolase)
MDFQDITQRALDIRKKYAAFEQKRYGAAWTNEELALGFIGDVGDLAKLIVAKNGKRDIIEADQKLAHELADCLWSVIILANSQNINLENSFLQTMDELEAHINNLLVEV